jgi:hypothetical protein
MPALAFTGQALPLRRRRRAAGGGRGGAAICSLAVPGVPARGANVARLARYLAADWHNPAQSMADPQFWAHIHACFRPLPNALLGGYAFYTESAYDYNLGLPYKTSVVLIVEAPDAANNPGALELASFKVQDPDEFYLGSHEPALLDGLTPDRLVPLDCGCNTVYVWLDDQAQYVGFSRPGKGCIIRRGGTGPATYLDSKITLASDRYAPWDLGRDLETDERVWGGAAGAFDFVAKSRFGHEVSDEFPLSK